MTSWSLFNDNIESVLSTGYLFLKMNPTVPFAHAISSLKQLAIYGWVEHNEERSVAGGASGREFTVQSSACTGGRGWLDMQTHGCLKNSVAGFQPNLIYFIFLKYSNSNKQKPFRLFIPVVSVFC